MLSPRNNAYDVVYTLGATPTETPESNVKPVNAATPQTAPVSDIVNRALQGSSANAQRYVNAVTAVAGAESASIAARSLDRQRSGRSGFADLANVIQQGINIASDVRAKSELARNEEERRIAEELRKREQEQRSIDLELEQQALRADAPQLLRSSTGDVGYMRRAQELINRYRDVADASTVVRVTGELLEPLQTYNRELVNATFGTLTQEQDSKRALQNSQFLLTYSGRLSQLEYASTPEEQARLTNEIIDNIANDTVNMSPFERAQATGALMAEMRSRYDVGSARFSLANATLTDINGYSAEIASALEVYESDRNLSNFRMNEARIASRYPNLPNNARYQSPDQDVQHALEMAQLQQNLGSARDELLLTAGESIQLGNDMVSDLAYTLFSNPASQPLYDSVLGNNPEYKQALAVAQLLRDQQTVNAEANERIQRYQLDMQNLQTQNVQQVLSWANSQNETERSQYDNQITNLLSIPGVSAEVRALAEQHLAARQAGGASIPPEQLAQLNQAIINSREQSIAIVQSQISLESARIANARSMLQPYGLDTPEGVRQQLANSRENLLRLNNDINTRRRSVAEQQGRLQIPGARSSATSPNFNMPRLSTATVGNVTAALPFAEGTVAPLTGGDGLYRQFRQYYNNGQGGYHQGIDVAVPAGTNLVSYVSGTVTFAGEAGEYGNFVEITSADGYVHQFAHLNSYGVKVGDTVNAGQVFASTGGVPGSPGAGRSTGAHLHWEVRLPGEGGRGETMNPLEYTAALANSVNARRPRNGQETDSPGMQLGNGQTLNNSQGASYSTANPLRQRYASVRAADYQRSADGSANFGYAALADDRSFRLALHRESANMGIPAQWLADVMGYETAGTFASDKYNYGGSGAVGIIQFMPATLAAYGYTPEQFAGFTNVQQLSVAVQYLEDVRREAGLERWRSPYDVLMAVWGGGNALYKFANDPESVRNYSDGDITWIEYTQRLGSNAGRRYTPVYDADVQHTSFVQGCPTCVALLNNGNDLYAHVVAAGDVRVS
jgi:murein DD-endopeptidase MepM/ murein hydrolase activator NlpD